MGPDGAMLPPGEVGEIMAARPLLSGYLDRAEETAWTIVNGWLHTGDLGAIDELGAGEGAEARLAGRLAGTEYSGEGEPRGCKVAVSQWLPASKKGQPGTHGIRESDHRAGSDERDPPGHDTADLQRIMLNSWRKMELSHLAGDPRRTVLPGGSAFALRNR